ncbi:MAG: hypothetical protein KGZ83_12265 [Sulfuricella sp.]|nr:hypothetical protein [Sulfuricella sp.]
MKTSRAVPLLAILLATAIPAWGAGSVDAGRTAFNNTCFNCHSETPSAAKYVPARFNADYLIAAFLRVGAMAGNLALGTQTINDIAAYLGAPSGNDTDRLLDWAEDGYPTLLTPPRQTTGQLAGYSYRFYPGSGLYVATRDGNVWLFDSKTSGATIQQLGTLRSFLEQMPGNR